MHLREVGIRSAQGYVFAPPLPGCAFIELVDAIEPLSAAKPAKEESGPRRVVGGGIVAIVGGAAAGGRPGCRRNHRGGGRRRDRLAMRAAPTGLLVVIVTAAGGGGRTAATRGSPGATAAERKGAASRPPSLNATREEPRRVGNRADPRDHMRHAQSATRAAIRQREAFAKNVINVCGAGSGAGQRRYAAVRNKGARARAPGRVLNSGQAASVSTSTAKRTMVSNA
jgi:hypothetical protein